MIFSSARPSRVEMVEKHFLCQGRALAQREQFQHLIFLAGQMHARAGTRRFLIEIDDEIACRDDRLGMTFRAPHDAWMRATSSSL